MNFTAFFCRISTMGSHQHSRIFVAEVYSGNELLATGRAENKGKARKGAAQKALAKLEKRYGSWQDFRR
jgi:dsRNA-specific ribonuclease